jgi:hypothetical protein
LTKDALRLGYLGDAATIEFCQRALRDHRPLAIKQCNLSEDIALRASLWRGNFRASVPPSKIAQFVEGANPDTWSADAAFGIVVGNGATDRHDALIRAARDASGSVSIYDDSGDPLHLPIDPAARIVIEKLKQSFDPDGKLRPLPTKDA